MSDPIETPFPRPVLGRPVADPPNGMVPARSPLVGRHIGLEPLDPGRHTAELYRASHGSDEAMRIWDFLPWGPWPDEASFLARMRGEAAAFDRVWYAMRPANSGIASGMATYLDIHPLDGVIEIGGIWFAPGLQRTRAATEALFLMLAHAMDDLRYRRMQWRCNALNVKARAAARRLGFRFEGIFYNHMVFKGRNRDTAWYSITDEEWPEVRGIILDWLDDGNFRPDGVSLKSLLGMMGERDSLR